MPKITVEPMLMESIADVADKCIGKKTAENYMSAMDFIDIDCG